MFLSLGDIYSKYLVNFSSWKTRMQNMRLVRLAIIDHGRRFKFYLHCQTATTIKTLKHYIAETDPEKRCPSWKIVTIKSPGDHTKIALQSSDMHLFFENSNLSTGKDDDSTTIGTHLAVDLIEYRVDVYWHI